MVELVKCFFTNPLLIAFLAALGVNFLCRSKHRCLILVVLMFYVLSVPITYNLGIRAWSISDTKEFSSPYDIAVVMTGVVDLNWYNFGKKRFPNVEYVALNQNKERIIAGIHLLKAGLVKQIYFGGLSVGSLSEAEVVRDFVLRQGIEKDRFVIFSSVANTSDEALGVRAYLANSPPMRVLLITTEVHMRRSLDAFQRQGLFPDTYSVARKNRKIEWQVFLPSPQAGIALESLLYEMLGWVGYYFQGKI